MAEVEGSSPLSLASLRSEPVGERRLPRHSLNTCEGDGRFAFELCFKLRLGTPNTAASLKAKPDTHFMLTTKC